MLMIQSQKLTITQKLVKSNLTSYFSARLKPTKLANKSDIVNYVKKTDFDNKLKDVTTYKNELNEL